MNSVAPVLRRQPQVDAAVSFGDKAPDVRSLVRERPSVRGKFLFVGDDKFWIKGATYGTFAPDASGEQFPPAEQVERDFAQMAENHINTVRVYTCAPRWLLDIAQRYGLRVMVGLPWEQHVAFLDDTRRADDIVARVRAGVRTCAGHPAVLCYAVGNEIPASILRWHGRRRIERFIRRLYDAAKEEDPTALVTYVNFPTTEYLQLPFLDLVCFNVYLESEERLAAYLARLQNLADERPLVLAEIGLDSRRNGEAAQAASIAWQVRTAFAEGCAGAIVFGWTDEWYRGGFTIDDWDFGLVCRLRQPKPALYAVKQAFANVPFPSNAVWPRITVVVCSYNGARTIVDTLDALQTLDYPDYEVIVVDDGSTDATPQIAAEYPVRLISTENRGLSAARNTGWQQATGEIVAYIDDDAYPDPHWLKYLAYRFVTTEHVGVGGPNIAPPGDGPIADCVANAPGGPVHVLLTDTIAEHIPGCNMAFRRSALAAVGGFDSRYRTAGDDVDLCWRLMDAGGTIGFHAGAMDWHHRRNSLAMYWKQQKGYGKAEALLEQKWPERYNALGHLKWSGRLYGRGLTEALSARRWRVYQGTWGTAAYQSLYEPGVGALLSLPLMPEWVFVIGSLALLSGLGVFWLPLGMVAWPLLILSIALPLAQASKAALHATFPPDTDGVSETHHKRLITALLHLLQPVARLIGRIEHGLTLWRRRGQGKSAAPWPYRDSVWSEAWHAPEYWVQTVEARLRAQGAIVMRGGDYDPWDLEIRGGTLGAMRGLFAVEEHGAGRQLLRILLWPRPTYVAVCLVVTLAILSIAAFSSSSWIAGAGLGGLAAGLAIGILRDCAAAAGEHLIAVQSVRVDAKGHQT